MVAAADPQDPQDAQDLAELLAAAAAAVPDQPAVVEAPGVGAGGGRRVTWAELDDEVSRIAGGLGAAGIVAGHRVMIVSGNRLELVTTYLAVLRAQAVAVPVNPGSTPDEIARMLADSGARLVVADADCVVAVRAAVTGLERPPRLVVVGATLRPGERSIDHLRAAPARRVPPLPDPEKLAALLYTSGTSGRPRAAMLTHRALIANLRQVGAVEPPMIGPDDVVLGVLPLFHVYGLNAVLGGVLWHRARLVIAPRFHPVGTLEVIAAEGCTVVPVAPAVLAHWRAVDDLGARLAGVRLVLSGSAPLEAEAVAAFAAATSTPLHQGYGLTEAAPVVTSTLCSDAARPGSVGAALPGVELRLVDAGGRAPEPGDAGEIQVRGANLFSGYWPDGADGPDAEGWWATGDVGFLEPAGDPSGDLTLVDRVRELVIVSGFNVFPIEVEAVLAEVEGVAEAAVIGVPDELTGEAVVAYLATGAAGDGGQDEAARAALVDAVRRHAAQRLSPFKRPTRYEVVDRLPLTVTGKVQKGRLRGLERRRTNLTEDLL